MFDRLIGMIAPHHCLVCGLPGTVWCQACSEAAPLSVSRCYRCHALSEHGRTCVACRRVSRLESVQAATRYEGVPKRLIWMLKFGRARAAAKPAAQLVRRRCPVPDGTVIVYVPTATSRVRRRGYDQSQLLARHIAGAGSFPAGGLLRRLGQRQQRSASRRQRLAQLRHDFRIARPGALRGAHVILVDDVVTTGATLEAAAAAVHAAGAKRVAAVVFAQA